MSARSYRISHGVVAPLSKALWRPTITGRDNVPPTGGVLIASNHLSFIDSFAIPIAAPRPVAFLAKSDYFTGTGVSGAVPACLLRELQRDPRRPALLAGGPGVARRRPPRAAGGRRVRHLPRGHPLARRPALQGAHRGGLARPHRRRARRAGGPVGTDRVQPVGASFPRLARVRVAFGRPIYPASFAGLPAGKARRLLTDEVMDAIAALVRPGTGRHYNELPPESTGAAVGI